MNFLVKLFKNVRLHVLGQGVEVIGEVQLPQAYEHWNVEQMHFLGFHRIEQPLLVVTHVVESALCASFEL